MIASTGPGERAMSSEIATGNDSLVSKKRSCQIPTDRLRARSEKVAVPFASVVTVVVPPRPCSTATLAARGRSGAAGALIRALGASLLDGARAVTGDRLSDTPP